MRHGWLLVVLAACGSKSAKAPAGGATMDEAVKAFNVALESGDVATVRAALPTQAVLSAHLDCGAAMARMMDDTAKAMLEIDDVKAIKGRHADFVSLDTTDAKVVPVGPFEGSCKVTKEWKHARVTATWKLDGEPHTTKLQLGELAGRWYVIDVPGM